MLLEDLLEQEKREQERQAVSNISNDIGSQQTQSNNSGLLSDHDFERLRADVMSAAPQGIPAQGLLPLQQQQSQGEQLQQVPANQLPYNTQNPAMRSQFMSRDMISGQWKANMGMPMQNPMNTIGVSGVGSLEGNIVKKEG